MTKPIDHDNLRDRVAAVIVGPGCDCGTCTAIALEKADAMIEALGLTRVTRSERVPKHRYVTEWETDD
jgi:hypothetical protein